MRRPLLLKTLVLFVFCAGLGRSKPGFTPRVGERLTYRVYMAGIALGEEVLLVKSTGEKEGRRFLVIEATVDSYPFFLKLLDYHERRVLWWEEETGAPLREEVSILRGRSLFQEVFSFEPEKSVVTRTWERDGEKGAQQLPLVPGAQTGLSLLYYLRRFPWEQGEERVALLGRGGTEWVHYKVREEKKPVEVPFGRFAATYHLYHPQHEYELWFERGPARLPLEIRSRQGFGLAQAKLVQAEGYR